jgi:phosphate transport system permease protein
MAIVSTPGTVAREAAERLTQPPERRRSERRFHRLLLVATTVAIVVLVVLLVDILADGVLHLRTSLFTSYASRFPDEFGFRSGITGTLSLMVLVAAIAFPIGVGAATYLEELAPHDIVDPGSTKRAVGWLRRARNGFARLVEANISNLAGVPSVVYGLLGAGVFVYFLGMGRSLLAGAITLSLLVLPVIIVAAREALRAVPQSLREAGLGLGATPLQTVSRQILPQAFPGILTGTILALSRAIGETAPILVVGAILSRRSDNAPWDTNDAFSAMPVQIYNLVSRPQPEFQIDVAAAGIIILMVLLLLMNSVAIVLRNRYSRSR